MVEHSPFYLFISKPAGVFINEFTEVIKNAENEPPIITGKLIKNVSIDFKTIPCIQINT